MDVQNVVRKVQNHYRDSDHRIQLPDEDPLRRHYDIEDLEESFRVSGDVDVSPEDKKNMSDIKEDILLQDLASYYPDKAAPKFEEIDRRIERDGIEAMAWYIPFHYETDEHPWGIYLLDRGIWTVVNALHPLRENNFITSDLIIFGARILFWHEFFHFLNEMAASTLEITSGFRSNNYTNYRERVYSHRYDFGRFQNHNVRSLDRDWHHRLRQGETGSVLEEALANAYCYKQSKNLTKGVANCLKPFMRQHPPGYRDFGLFSWRNSSPTDKFRVGCSILGSLLSSTDNNDAGSPYESLFDIYRKEVKITDVPVYLVRSNENGLGQYGESARIFLYAPPPAVQWRRHKNFLREWRRLTKGRNERNLQSQLDDTLASASSENWHDRESVGCKKIMGNDHLREFRVTHSLRAFYKSCENNLHVLVGIQEHPKRGDYNRLYTNDYCAEYS